MPNISWNESAPAGADSVGIGAGEIRSTKTALRTALDAEHNFPSTGGDAGVHRMGSGRPFYGLQSAVSSSGTDSRVMITSDTSRLFHVGSGGTSFLGGPTVISAGTYPGGAPPQRYVWVEEWGTGHTISGSTTITIPNSGYSSTPNIQLTAYNINSATQLAQMLYVDVAFANSFLVRSNGTNNLINSTTSFFWRTIGRRIL